MNDSSESGKSSQSRSLLLLAAGAVMVGSILYTVTHLEDRAVFTVLLPGVAVGLLLVGLYIRAPR
jgi:membrane protease YdiL (CAAX protease family)